MRDTWGVTALVPLVLGLVVSGSAAGAARTPAEPDGRGATTTIMISVSRTGTPGDLTSYGRAISPDGRYVAYASLASNLVPGDTNRAYDVFLWDRRGGRTSRVSVPAAGGQANGDSVDQAISADGRHVAFDSTASNLVPGDTNGVADIFVRDRRTGTTSRVSVSTGGLAADGESHVPAMSADGRYVAFYSEASNLVSGDINGAADIFVHDRRTGTTSRVSVPNPGGPGGGPGGGSFQPAISADGRYVAFTSAASNLVPADTNDVADIFVRDRRAGTTSRISLSGAGAEADDRSGEPAISADGRYVAYTSEATNLVRGDTNAAPDVFVSDRRGGSTRRVSVSGTGVQANAASFSPSISADGRLVGFDSLASNLVAGDTNDMIDAFLRNRPAGVTSRVSLSGSGAQADAHNYNQSISADGRYVVFSSWASNLTPGDVPDTLDVFLRTLARRGATR